MRIIHISVLMIIPTIEFHDCLKKMMIQSDLMAAKMNHLTLADLRMNSLAIVLPANTTQELVDQYMKQHWSRIVDMQLQLWCNQPHLFPKVRDYQTVKSWFTYELHNSVYQIPNENGHQITTRTMMATLVLPTESFVNWLGENCVHLNLPTDIPLHFKVERLKKFACVYLSSQLKSEHEIQQYIENYAEKILVNEFAPWCDNPSIWPTPLDVASFRKYFSIESHLNILTLSDLMAKEQQPLHAAVA